MITEPRNLSVHFPIALFLLAFAALLGAQLGDYRHLTGTLEWEIETAKQNIKDLEALKEQQAEAIKNREATVKQSVELQAKFQAVLTDLLELAKENPEARQIVTKWSIRQNAQPAAEDPDVKDSPM